MPHPQLMHPTVLPRANVHSLAAHIRARGIRSLVCLLVVLLASVAHADEPPIRKPTQPQALEHLTRGNKLYNVRSFDEAVLEYKAGAVIEGAPIFDYNLGQCYRQLGKYRDAIWHYQRFAKASPETQLPLEAVQKFIEQMQAELDKKAMTEPPTEAAASSQPDSATPNPAPSAQVEDAPEPWYRDRLGLGFAAAGVVGLAVGGGFLISAASTRDDANAATNQVERNDLFEKADTRSTIGTVAMIGGGALLATGVIMFAIPNERERPRSASIALSPSGFSVQGRF